MVTSAMYTVTDIPPIASGEGTAQANSYYSSSRNDKTNRTKDNTDLSSRNIIRTMRNDGGKDWWFTSFRHSVFVLICTHMNAFPFANWPAPSPTNARARLHPGRP